MHINPNILMLQEKVNMLRENEILRKEKARLMDEKVSLVQSKDLADGQISNLMKSLEATQRDLRDRENQVRSVVKHSSWKQVHFSYQDEVHHLKNEFQVQVLKQLLEQQRRELNECRAEVTSLKMHIEGSLSGRNVLAGDADSLQSQTMEKYREEIKSLQLEIETLKAKEMVAPNSLESIDSLREEAVIEIHEDNGMPSQLVEVSSGIVDHSDVRSLVPQTSDSNLSKFEEVSGPAFTDHSNYNGTSSDGNVGLKHNGEAGTVDSGLHVKSGNLNGEATVDKMVG